MTVEPVFVDRVTRPFQTFLRHKLAGAALLLLFTVIALVWANSGYEDSYYGLLHTYATIGIGEFELSKTQSH